VVQENSVALSLRRLYPPRRHLQPPLWFALVDGKRHLPLERLRHDIKKRAHDPAVRRVLRRFLLHLLPRASCGNPQLRLLANLAEERSCFHFVYVFSSNPINTQHPPPCRPRSAHTRCGTAALRRNHACCRAALRAQNSSSDLPQSWAVRSMNPYPSLASPSRFGTHTGSGCIGKRRTYKLSVASRVESYEFPAAESILRTMQEK